MNDWMHFFQWITFIEPVHMHMNINELPLSYPSVPRSLEYNKFIIYANYIIWSNQCAVSFRSILFSGEKNQWSVRRYNETQFAQPFFFVQNRNLIFAALPENERNEQWIDYKREYAFCFCDSYYFTHCVNPKRKNQNWFMETCLKCKISNSCLEIIEFKWNEIHMTK